MDLSSLKVGLSQGYRKNIEDEKIGQECSQAGIANVSVGSVESYPAD